MYRQSHDSFGQTVERLEREVAELRGLSRARGRERALAVTAALGIVSSLVLGAACLSAHTRAERLERHLTQATVVLQARAQDLSTCVDLAEKSERAASECRVEWAQTSARASANGDAL